MKATVGLPVYNVELYVKDAVLSIMAQTFEDWECIVIDDGSTDKSLDIIKEYADSRFIIISDGENKGLVSRLNQIIGLAKGEYIVRMDGDDIMHPDRLARQVEVLDTSPQIDVVSTLKYSIGLDNYVHKCEQPVEIEDADVAYALLKSGYISHATIVSRASWSRQNLYSESYTRAEDRELFARAINGKNSRILPQALYYYREIGNMSLKKYTQSYRSELKVLLKYGMKRVGAYQTARLIARWLAKSVVIRIMFSLGIEGRLKKDGNADLYQRLEETAFLSRFLQEAERKLSTSQKKGLLTGSAL